MAQQEVNLASKQASPALEDFISQILDFELFEFLGLIFQISPTYSIFYKNRSLTVRHSDINLLTFIVARPIRHKGDGKEKERFYRDDYLIYRKNILS